MTYFSRSRRVAVTTLTAMLIAVPLALSGCATATVPAMTSTADPSATPVATISSNVLLDKQAQTILDQAIAYPSSVPAQVSSSIITIPPGVETGLHRHDAPMYAYILEGELTVTYDGGVVKVYTVGEAIMEAVGTAHNGKNNTSADVKVLVVNVGAEGVANNVKLP